MNQAVNDSGGAGPSHRNVEVGVAIFMVILALIAIYGGIKVGIGWGDEGPKAGFFPFYIGVIVVISCAVNIFRLLRGESDDGTFATWNQLRKVMTVVVPTTIYVFIIPYTGIYAASALLIAAFMIWLGKYRWILAIPIAIAVPLLTFMLFEIWFLVPLPKGPLENFLGY